MEQGRYDDSGKTAVIAVRRKMTAVRGRKATCIHHQFEFCGSAATHHPNARSAAALKIGNIVFVNFHHTIQKNPPKKSAHIPNMIPPSPTQLHSSPKMAQSAIGLHAQGGLKLAIKTSDADRRQG